MSEPTKHLDVDPNQVTFWKNQLVAQSAQFDGEAKAAAPPVGLKHCLPTSCNWRWRMIF